KEHRAHAAFLALLNSITARAFEADNLSATLEILTEQITKLYEADDGFLTFWDADKKMSIPTVAYGSMHDIYPYMRFEPGEQTLATAVIQARHPIPVTDVDNSPYISSKVAALFPSHSVLGLPLILQDRNLGAFILSYSQPHEFSDDELAHAELTAEQIA